jgi:hypothetical protein
MIRIAAFIVALLTAVTASAQLSLIDPDDFLSPRATGGRPILISRLVMGAGANMSGDGFRPLGETFGYVHLATSFSWRSVQFGYKRSEMKGEDGEAEVLRIIPPPEIIPNPNGSLLRGFPTAPSVQQTRYATPKSKDTLHAAWYWPVAGGGGGIPVMLRSRVTFTTQPMETDVVTPMPGIGTTTLHASERERTFALDSDTWFRIAGHDVFGSLAFSETKTTTTNGIVRIGGRNERALTYTNRFPSLSFNTAKILIRPTLTVGAISNRGASAVNLVNPAIEFFRPFTRTGANLHVIYSPQWIANGERWRTTHQVVLLIDRALFVKVF